MNYTITYDVTAITVTGCADATACDWVTFHPTNNTFNGVMSPQMSINGCCCRVTVVAKDEGDAESPDKLYNICPVNTAPYGTDVEMCVFDG